MKTYIYLFLLLLLVVQCVPDKESPYQFQVEKNIIFEDISYPELLGETMQLIKYDSLLFVNDYFGDSLIHVFNLKTKRIEKRLIAKGNGPNEAITPLEIQLTKDYLYLLSRPLYSLYHVNLTSIMKDSILLYHDLQLPSLSDCFVALKDSQFVFSGFWKKRYAYLNLNRGQELKEFGEYPDSWSFEKSLPSDVKAFFHQCRFVKHPSKNLFVSCSGYVLEIYEFDPLGKDLPHLIFRKILGKYSYDYVEGELVTAKVREGSDPSAKELACSENYIYVVIQSKSDKTKRNIMMLGWDGHPVMLLKSDKKITCLSIDEMSKKGYCIVKDPEDKLVSFDLPDK